MTAQSRPADLRPGTRAYVESLPGPERRAATARLAALPAADLAALGVSEPLPDEFDYPVRETGGSVPAGLRGVLYRNGPGHWEDHRGRPLRHLFDGDGMVSRFAIDERGVHYRNRYVRTRHYRGKGSTRHLGTPSPGGRLANLAAPAPPNLANTNVVRHAGRLLALWEGGPPHELDPDTLETLGPRRFGGRLRWLGSYSAHPNLCPATGTLYNFGVEIVPAPHLRVYATSAAGRLRHRASVRLPYPAMVHDFAITDRHLVFLVSPIVPDLLPVITARSTIGQALRYRPDKGSVVITIDRGTGATRTVECDPVLQFHLSNAFEHGTDLVIDAITYRDGEILSGIADFHTRTLDRAPSQFTRFTVTGTRVGREALSDTPCEFPRHHPGHEGRPHRYSYVASRHALGSFYDGITKLDLERGREDVFVAQEPGNSFCEPVFVPDPSGTAEDDGWLLTVEYRAALHRSRLTVFDARDLQAGPCFTAELSHHVPQGFHGNFHPAG